MFKSNYDAVNLCTECQKYATLIATHPVQPYE